MSCRHMLILQIISRFRIDIMEVMGQETNKAYGTIHYGEPHDQSQGTYYVSVANNFADRARLLIRIL